MGSKLPGSTGDILLCACKTCLRSKFMINLFRFLRQGVKKRATFLKYRTVYPSRYGAFDTLRDLLTNAMSLTWFHHSKRLIEALVDLGV